MRSVLAASDQFNQRREMVTSRGYAVVCHSRVEEGRGGGRLPVAMAGAFTAAPQSGLPWPRFPSPLIEPNVPISGIRLCASEGEKHFPSITATSALGYKQTSSRPKSKSAYPPTADILVAVTDFRF